MLSSHNVKTTTTKSRKAVKCQNELNHFVEKNTMLQVVGAIVVLIQVYYVAAFVYRFFLRAPVVLTKYGSWAGI